MTEPVAGAMETATAEKEGTGTAATAAKQKQEYYIDTGYYADIVQQPVRVRCSEYYNNGVVSYPIEPCIVVQLHRKVQLDILGSSIDCISLTLYPMASSLTRLKPQYYQNTSLLVARAILELPLMAALTGVYFAGSLEVKVQTTSYCPIIHCLTRRRRTAPSLTTAAASIIIIIIGRTAYTAQPTLCAVCLPNTLQVHFDDRRTPQAIRDHPSHSFVDASHPLQQSLISTSNRGSTHIPPFAHHQA
ncbi:hypothetical protein BASA83_012874 [Batrachochytrium salamandrivorans]|nr:hypothetical protein BASA83_012874 [Batrachochytrium salamandrivorans]